MKAMGYARSVVTSIYLAEGTSSLYYTLTSGNKATAEHVDLSSISVANAQNASYADNAGYATSATNDGSSNNIESTYAKKSDLLNSIYPVGSIYMSTNNNSPQNFLGGTWVRIEGRFLLGAGSVYNAGSTGGEATHKLDLGEMPSHGHTVRVYGGVSSGGYSYVAKAGPDYVTATSTSVTGSGTLYSVTNMSVSSNGSGQAHNNMPPYLAVYIWKRTA